MDLSQGEFRVANEQDAAALSQRLADYLQAHGFSSVLPFRIVDAYRIFSKHQEAPRLNAAYLDVLLTYTHMLIDAWTLCAIWNDRFSKGKLEGGNALDCSDRFIHKAEMHRNAGAFVFRYRALWDKIMGLLLLKFAPDQYEQFAGAKRSRLNKFKDIAQSVDAFSKEFVESSHALARAFDDSYRTTEVHGTGSLRRWIYNMQPTQEDSPLLAFTGFWNEFQPVLISVDELIVGAPPAPERQADAA